MATDDTVAWISALLQPGAINPATVWPICSAMHCHATTTSWYAELKVVPCCVTSCDIACLAAIVNMLSFLIYGENE